MVYLGISIYQSYIYIYDYVFGYSFGFIPFKFACYIATHEFLHHFNYVYNYSLGFMPFKVQFCSNSLDLCPLFILLLRIFSLRVR
ncbi:hypothetical protein H8356DRAFT_1409564 [Neocallimastix lanati (nom. inval.)]|nr:hypothetical protein H8356DRAFT_1409564 [Neocallimastix sp. JGI-2020a]